MQNDESWALKNIVTVTVGRIRYLRVFLLERCFYRTEIFFVRFLGNREKLFFLATIVLAALILILILVIGCLFRKAHAKKDTTEKKKSDHEVTDVGNNPTYENIPGNEHAFIAEVSTPDDWQTELSTYTSLERKNDETDENHYSHLNKNTDKMNGEISLWSDWCQK